ncbi:MAG: carboxymuconolactone decarboxylase, partial [Comamonadaceae bacterium]
MTANATSPSPASASASLDTIDRIAGLATGSSAYAVRHQRDKVAVATQGCEDALFGPDLPGGLTQAERLAVAHDIAHVSGLPALAAHYRSALQALAAPLAPALRTLVETPDAAAAAEQMADTRLQAIVHFARTLATRPAQSDQAALLALPAAGLSVPDTVLLAQLIGFVTYQLRVVAGVAALAQLQDSAGAAAGTAQADAAAAPFVHPANLPAPGEPLRLNGYTSETLGWKAWLPVLDPTAATPEQNEVLDLSHPKARTSDFYLLLAHQPRVLSERSQAFNAIMYAPGGLSRAEREVASTVVSRVNGCVYCASV